LSRFCKWNRNSWFKHMSWHAWRWLRTLTVIPAFGSQRLSLQTIIQFFSQLFIFYLFSPYFWWLRLKHFDLFYPMFNHGF
jgi:hypothetical protein